MQEAKNQRALKVLLLGIDGEEAMVIGSHEGQERLKAKFRPESTRFTLQVSLRQINPHLVNECSNKTSRQKLKPKFVHFTYQLFPILSISHTFLSHENDPDFLFLISLVRRFLSLSTSDNHSSCSSEDLTPQPSTSCPQRLRTPQPAIHTRLYGHPSGATC